MLSLAKYLTISTLTVTAVVYHAFTTRKQYFPAMIYLASSKLSVAALGNLVFAVALLMFRIITMMFLGILRESEVERVNERINQAIIETCLAMTIFRQEFNVWFVSMFGLLAFVKVFHWLVQDRVAFVESSPVISISNHIRLAIFMLILTMIDIIFAKSTIAHTLKQGASIQILFAFEYVILGSLIFSTIMKYGITLLDSATHGIWESKGLVIFYLELLTDMIHLVVYTAFFLIVSVHYGLPLHLLRDLYWTFRNFRNRLTDFLRYRKVLRHMGFFPEATEEDLQRCDNICIICREDMILNGGNKKLRCGHVFHLHCMRTWLERQQNCPTCRTMVFPPRQTSQPGDGPALVNGQQGLLGEAQVPQQQRQQPFQAMAGVQQQQQQQQWQQQQVDIDGQQEQGGVSGVNIPPSINPEQPQISAQDADTGDQNNVEAVPGGEDSGGYAVQYSPVGIVWNMPQLLPITSMAQFSGAQFQYAGQVAPENANPEQPVHQQGFVFPVLPVMSANMVVGDQYGGQQQRRDSQHREGRPLTYTPFAPLMMMPPSVSWDNVPSTSSSSHVFENQSRSVLNLTPAQARDAQEAAQRAVAASVEATQQVLQCQLSMLQAQLDTLKQHKINFSNDFKQDRQNEKENVKQSEEQEEGQCQ